MLLRGNRTLGFSTLLTLAAASGAGCEIEWDDGGIVNPPTVTPIEQSVVVSDVRPPPLSGGTLLASRDGTRLLASDPDRDRIVVVDVSTSDPDRFPRIDLQPGDEPGRAVEDGSGHAHVALRRGGAIVTVDLQDGSLISRRDVCSAPRGLAFDAAKGALHVACATGELITLDVGRDGAPTRTLRALQLEPDLRDVVVSGDRLLVSSFRSAEILTVDPAGEIVRRAEPRQYTNQSSGRLYDPTVAWRMIPKGSGGALVVHQRSASQIIAPPPAGSGAAYYGGPDCSTSIVNSAVTAVGPDGDVTNEAQRGGLGMLVMPIDIALSADEARIAVVSASGDVVRQMSLGGVLVEDGCDTGGSASAPLDSPSLGEPIAAAYVSSPELDPETGQGSAEELVVQLREPSSLIFLDSNMQIRANLALGNDDEVDMREDSGHALFHRNPDGFTAIACASCHPEGRDDGHTWLFQNVLGGRRTQSLAGGVMDTAPFHWDGDIEDLNGLMTLVFEQRMGGVHQSDERVDVLASWLDTIPRVGPLAMGRDAASIARGQELFNDSEVACATCHTGPAMTNDATVDVGTGKEFQVPSLIGIRDRAPFMHDGCAQTLADRFDPACGGGDAHGKTSHLSAAQLSDLLHYLDTL